MTTASAAFAENEVIAESKVEDVTVFLSGAQVHRKGRFLLKKGTNQVIFEGVSPGINANSIQVKGKGNYIILDVSHRIHYPTPETPTNTIPDKILREIRLLEDSVKLVGYDLEETQIQRQAFQMELDMLLGSGVIKGQSKSDSIELLQKAMDYMRVKVREINVAMLKLKREEASLSSEQSRMNTRLTQLRNYNANSGFGQKSVQPVQRVVVTVSAKEATSASMSINYMVSNASWSPSYDLRATTTSDPVTITYKANIRQNSGEDWKDVDLTLSSVNPNRSNIKPELPMWYLNYYQPIYTDRSSAGYGGISEGLEESSKKLSGGRDKDLELSLDASKPSAQHVSNYFQMNESLTNVEFKVNMPYTIESNGKDHLIAVQQSEIPASYTHYMVPKIDMDAFLVAKLTDWEKLNLLPAVANIFYDGTYVGQTRINPAVMSDTIDLALGRDRGIVVKRNKIKDEEKVKPLSSEKVKTVTWELEVRNNKSSNVNLVLLDQIPVTLNEEIKISLEDKGKASHSESTGKLEWRLKLDSRDQKKLEYTYSIKYDKDKSLALR